MPARTPYIGGIPSRAIQLPGIMFATLGVGPVGHLGQNPCHPFLKLQTYPQTKSPLHFYGTSGLLPLITLFLSHLLTPTTRTLPPCSNITSPSLLSKYFFKKILLYFALQYCIGFTIHWHELAMGVHKFPILNPPPTSHPISSLWVIPMHQPQATCILYRT